MAQITDETLAYLNENLNLVTEYVQTHPHPYATQLLPNYATVLALIRHTDRANPGYLANSADTLIRISHNANIGVLAYDWRNLLKYVEDNDNTPPVLK